MDFNDKQVELTLTSLDEDKQNVSPWKKEVTTKVLSIMNISMLYQKYLDSWHWDLWPYHNDEDMD